MFFSCLQLCPLIWYLVVLLPWWSAAQLTFPAIAEVDLIFPRNSTYAPTPLTPVVFAVQNPQLSTLLHLQFAYYISSVGNNNASGSGSEVNDFLNIEGAWVLIWEAFASNCSQGITPASATQSNHVFFTIKNGAQQPDLVAATADDICAGNPSFTFNVTESVDASGFSAHLASCAALAPTALPSPSANPCAARINSSAASSISAALSSSVYAAIHPAAASCSPTGAPTRNDGVSMRSENSVRETAWLIASCSWLVYTTAL